MFTHIAYNNEILSGKPHIMGTRLSVEFILELFASGATKDEVLKAYPQLTGEAIEEALKYAAQSVKNEILIKYSNVVVAVALFGYVICIQVVKYFWGRVRFRELDAAFLQFTPWYLPQGITGSDSFPSGHAAMGWMLLPLLILLANKKQWVKYSTLRLFIYALAITGISSHVRPSSVRPAFFF